MQVKLHSLHAVFTFFFCFGLFYLCISIILSWNQSNKSLQIIYLENDI